MFRDPPDEQTWTTELAGQTRIAVTPGEALVVVRDGWATAIG
jgi:hypothetical protein